MLFQYFLIANIQCAILIKMKIDLFLENVATIQFQQKKKMKQNFSGEKIVVFTQLALTKYFTCIEFVQMVSRYKSGKKNVFYLEIE